MEDDVLRRIETEEKAEIELRLGEGSGVLKAYTQGRLNQVAQKRSMEEYARMQELLMKERSIMDKRAPEVPKDPCEKALGKNRYVVLLELMKSWIAKESSLTGAQRMDVSIYMLNRLEDEIGRDSRFFTPIFTPKKDDQTQTSTKPRQIDLSDDPAYGTFPPRKVAETP